MNRCTLAVVVLLGIASRLFAPSAVRGAAPGARALTLPAAPLHYADPLLPPHFEKRWIKALDTTPLDNPTTDAGATLGRVLYYDTRLSASNRVSCGTCHLQKHAFAEPRRVSVGHEGRNGDRNTMSLVNLRFSRAGFFWDERADTLEDAVGLPLRSRIEMGSTGPAMVKAISADPRYALLFKAAFGSETVSEKRIRQALAQFIRAMVSCDSKYDRGAAKAASVKEAFPNFTPEENRGKDLFLRHCNLCHHIGESKHVAFFGMFRALNNGLDGDAAALDGGRGDFTLNPAEVGQFKASSLRNVAVTGPYMHDGRFDTLEQVIEHYSSRVKRHPNVGAVGRLALRATDKAALVAFLRTLTDETFLADPKFSDPWTGSPKPVLKDDAIADRIGNPPPKKQPPVTERIGRGDGLEVGEVLPWLKSLDRNGDGSLDKDELEPVLAVLVRTRVAVLASGRFARNEPPAVKDASSAGKKAGHLRGDFDGDGNIDEVEARVFEAFKRLVELGDGAAPRRAVRTDRFLGRFDLTVDQAEAARKVLNAGRMKLARQRHALDLELLAKLEKLVGKNAVVRFQTLVIDRQVAAVRRRTAREDNPRPNIERQVLQFDRDGDGKFSANEVADLARALDGLPGGFGQAASPGIDMVQFARRFTAYDPASQGTVAVARLPERLTDFAIRGDRNRDKVLSSAELEESIRATAFERLLEEGVYVGGGFTNLLQRHADAVKEWNLSDETREMVEALFADHARQLETVTATATAELFAAFRDALGKKAPSPAKR